MYGKEEIRHSKGDEPWIIKGGHSGRGNSTHKTQRYETAQMFREYKQFNTEEG